MVWEIKCHQCEDVKAFGGSPPKQIPEDVIEWDGNYYCRECVQEFVRLGVGDVRERLDYVEEKLQEASEALGIEFAFPDER